MKPTILHLILAVTLPVLTVASATGSAAASLVSPDMQDVEQLAAAVEMQPNTIEAHLNLVIGLLLQGRNSEALQAVETALVIWPDEAVLHANRAVAYIRLGRTDAANLTLEAALDGRQTPRVGLSPEQQAELHTRFAWALVARGQPDEAARHLDQANELSDNRYVPDALRLRASHPSNEGLADLLRMQATGHADARAVALARTYRALGRPSDAARTLDRAPDLDEAGVRAARLALQRQRPAGSVDPPDYAFLLRLYDQLAQERWQDALGGAERLEATAYAVDAKLIKARAYLGAGKLRSAARAFEALAAQLPPSDPNYRPAIAGRVEALHRQGAHAELLRAAVAHPVPVDALDLRTAVALAQANEGETQAAEQTLESVLDEDPNYAPALSLQSQLRAGVGP